MILYQVQIEIDLVFKIAPVGDKIQEAVFEYKFGSLKTFRQILPGSFFNNSGSGKTDPTGPDPASVDPASTPHSIRGGSYRDNPEQCRSAVRESGFASAGIVDVGFRVARSRPDQ